MLIKNIYKISRLILLTIIITYFTGCAFYFISSLQQTSETTFITFNELDNPAYTNLFRFVTSCYYAMATLSTVGYGDLYPVTNLEKCVAICIMIAGVVLFSFIMSSFVQIISNFKININAGPDES